MGQSSPLPPLPPCVDWFIWLLPSPLVAKTHPSSPNYGAVGMMLMRGHSQAKKRVVYFLSVFIITGIASESGSCNSHRHPSLYYTLDVVLSLLFLMFEGRELQKGVTKIETDTPKDHLGPWFRTVVYITQVGGHDIFITCPCDCHSVCSLLQLLCKASLMH